MVKLLSHRFAKVTAALSAVVLIAGLLAEAALAQELPPYARASYGGDEVIHGRIASINGTFNISVNDDRGFVDNVDLHQGTIINPTGLTLEPGMPVTIAGYAEGGAFDAIEINTPYTYAGPVPIPVYYGPGWWYPGFAYGYGPAFSLSLVIGGGGPYFVRGPWHGRAYLGRPFPVRPYRASFVLRGSSIAHEPMPVQRAPIMRESGPSYHTSFAGRARASRGSHEARGGRR